MSAEPSPIPPRVLAAAGALLAVSLVLTAVSRYTGIGRLETPKASAVRTIDVRFSDTSEGGIIVTHADGRTLATLAAGTNGFIRGVVRSLVRVRRLDRVKVDPPFRLTQWSDHRLTIDDPATGESVELTGFGRDNRAAFARLLAGNATLAKARNP